MSRPYSDYLASFGPQTLQFCLVLFLVGSTIFRLVAWGVRVFGPSLTSCCCPSVAPKLLPLQKLAPKERWKRALGRVPRVLLLPLGVRPQQPTGFRNRFGRPDDREAARSFTAAYGARYRRLATAVARRIASHLLRGDDAANDWPRLQPALRTMLGGDEGKSSTVGLAPHLGTAATLAKLLHAMDFSSSSSSSTRATRGEETVAAVYIPIEELWTSCEQWLVLSSLGRLGVPADMQRAVREIYDQTTVRKLRLGHGPRGSGAALEAADDDDDDVEGSEPLTRGLKPRCPLTAVLIAAVLDVPLASVVPKPGQEAEVVQIKALPFANALVLVTTTTDESRAYGAVLALQRSVAAFGKWLRGVKMDIDVGACMYCTRSPDVRARLRLHPHPEALRRRHKEARPYKRMRRPGAERSSGSGSGSVSVSSRTDDLDAAEPIRLVSARYLLRRVWRRGRRPLPWLAARRDEESCAMAQLGRSHEGLLVAPTRWPSDVKTSTTLSRIEDGQDDDWTSSGMEDDEEEEYSSEWEEDDSSDSSTY